MDLTKFADVNLENSCVGQLSVNAMVSAPHRFMSHVLKVVFVIRNLRCGLFGNGLTFTL